jgi:hypothetical protein
MLITDAQVHPWEPPTALIGRGHESRNVYP